MLVKFANCEVPIWKLRKGVVLGCGPEYVHVFNVLKTTLGTNIGVEHPDGTKLRWPSVSLIWLEPH